jgi:hypothetical protein
VFLQKGKRYFDLRRLLDNPTSISIESSSALRMRLFVNRLDGRFVLKSLVNICTYYTHMYICTKLMD